MLGVLAQVTVVLLSLAITYPLSRVVTIAATVLLATWGIEALGSATGFPFGHYVYTSKLQPQSGGVPWLIPFAWLMMLPPAWAGLWVWEIPGGYFGIPWINFAGWWLSSAILTWIIHPRKLSRPPLLTIYTLTWAFQAIGLGLFWGQPGPALVGFFGMGVFVFSSLFVELRR